MVQFWAEVKEKMCNQNQNERLEATELLTELQLLQYPIDELMEGCTK